MKPLYSPVMPPCTRRAARRADTPRPPSQPTMPPPSQSPMPPPSQPPMLPPSQPPMLPPSQPVLSRVPYSAPWMYQYGAHVPTYPQAGHPAVYPGPSFAPFHPGVAGVQNPPAWGQVHHPVPLPTPRAPVPATHNAPVSAGRRRLDREATAPLTEKGQVNPRRKYPNEELQEGGE
jgi:hypothetical protein